MPASHARREHSDSESHDEDGGILVHSDSQDITKSSDGHTGMSQDFLELNTSSPRPIPSPKLQSAMVEIPTVSTRTTRKSTAAAAKKNKNIIPTTSEATTSYALTVATASTISVRTTTTSEASGASFIAPTETSLKSVATPTSSPAIKSYGTVCVVKRPSENMKDNIEAYAIQNTFYAYPLDATKQMKDDIRERNKKITDDFEFQKYEMEIYEFGLPFEVGMVCRISSRCGMTPKRHKIATSGAKRKRGTGDSSASSSDADEDIDISPVAAAACKKRR